MDQGLEGRWGKKWFYCIDGGNKRGASVKRLENRSQNNCSPGMCEVLEPSGKEARK